MYNYKPHYACFDCRKTFKRRLFSDIRKGTEIAEAKCPQCGKLMANMGLDFAAPPKDEVKKWEHLRNLYEVGITFHSCGCTGPGYIPRDKEQLLAHFERILSLYHQHLEAFRKRTEPQTQSEKDRDRQYHSAIITSIPREIRGKNPFEVKNEDAKNYWFGKIKEVEHKIAAIKLK